MGHAVSSELRIWPLKSRGLVNEALRSKPETEFGPIEAGADRQTQAGPAAASFRHYNIDGANGDARRARGSYCEGRAGSVLARCLPWSPLRAGKLSLTLFLKWFENTLSYHPGIRPTEAAGGVLKTQVDEGTDP